MKDFASSFSAADKLIVTDIYAASETPIPGVSGEGFCRAVRESGHADAAFVPRPEVYAALENEIRPGDLVMVLGAGDIEEVAWELAAHLNLFREVRGKVVPSEGLAKHTSLRIGGPAEFWIEPADAEDLRRAVLICRGKNLPIHIFGAGSNVLAPDEGLKGAVIHLGAAYFKEARVEKETITARAGVPNSLFIQLALENGFGGCEFLSGIPGNLGGAVAMNAGSHGQSMDSILEEITLLTFEGEFKKLKKSEIGFGYRSSGIRDGVIVEAVFRLPRRARETVQKKLDEYHAHRMNTQDLKHPSAGCLFKNPAEGARSSGKLIDEAGLKGLTVGRAQVSTVHANFLINLGGASAKDVTALIEAVRRRVREKAGVDLETEVKIL
ncbi:MAG: UDP-N-acetylmuramate dehydrogenase [Candidatus Omnitrophica bacterium]|nr:UDP-N-acetylmuramate dehydrogenase [Candidatus Omnitrophota bacterium]